MASARLLFIPLLHLLLSVSVPASDVRENLAVYLVQVDGEEPVGFQQKTSDDLSSKRQVDGDVGLDHVIVFSVL